MLVKGLFSPEEAASYHQAGHDVMARIYNAPDKVGGGWGSSKALSEKETKLQGCHDLQFYDGAFARRSGINESDEARTTLLVQMRDPEDTPTQDVHKSQGQSMMLRSVDPTCRSKSWKLSSYDGLAKCGMWNAERGKVQTRSSNPLTARYSPSAIRHNTKICLSYRTDALGFRPSARWFFLRKLS